MKMFSKGLSAQDLKITIASGLDFSLPGLTSSATLFEVKEAIQSLKGFKIDQQILSLDCDRDAHLADSKPLKDYGLLSLNESPTRGESVNVLHLVLYNKPVLLKINLGHSLLKNNQLLQRHFSQDTSVSSLQNAAEELEVRTYPSCSVYCLKQLIQKQTQISINDQVLIYQGVTLENDKALYNYQISDKGMGASAIQRKLSSTGEEAAVYNNTPNSFRSGSEIKEYEINLVTMKKKKNVPSLNLQTQQNQLLPTANPDIQSSYSLSLGIDFTFNTIKNVKKVGWQEDAPWFREISDGFCWLCYCQNTKCQAYKQLVVINKGYGVFSIKKELPTLRCPCCMSSKSLEIRNSGFVNCEWAMRGILTKNKESKIYADGKTYDSKLYTFKECDYKTVWHALDIMVKHLDEKTSLKNLPSARENKVKNNRMIDKALEKEGVPIPQSALPIEGQAVIVDDEDSEYSEEEGNTSPYHQTIMKIDEDGNITQSNNAPIGVLQQKCVNISYQPSAREKGGAFCCTEAGIKVGCSMGGSNKTLNTSPSKDETSQANSKCLIF